MTFSIYPVNEENEVVARLEEIANAPEKPMTFGELKNAYLDKYGMPNIKSDFFEGVNIFERKHMKTIGDLVEEYKLGKHPSGINPNARLFYTKEEQIKNWIKEFYEWEIGAGIVHL